MNNNNNTTIDKIAQMHFGIHYHELDSDEKQWCHEEMVNNNKWLK